MKIRKLITLQICLLYGLSQGKKEMQFVQIKQVNDMDIQDWHKTSLLSDDQTHDSFDSTLTNLLVDEQNSQDKDVIKIENANQIKKKLLDKQQTQNLIQSVVKKHLQMKNVDQKKISLVHKIVPKSNGNISSIVQKISLQQLEQQNKVEIEKKKQIEEQNEFMRPFLELDNQAKLFEQMNLEQQKIQKETQKEQEIQEQQLREQQQLQQSLKEQMLQKQAQAEQQKVQSTKKEELKTIINNPIILNQHKNELDENLKKEKVKEILKNIQRKKQLEQEVKVEESKDPNNQSMEYLKKQSENLLNQADSLHNKQHQQIKAEKMKKKQKKLKKEKKQKLREVKQTIQEVIQDISNKESQKVSESQNKEENKTLLANVQSSQIQNQVNNNQTVIKEIENKIQSELISKELKPQQIQEQQQAEQKTLTPVILPQKNEVKTEFQFSQKINQLEIPKLAAIMPDAKYTVDNNVLTRKLNPYSQLSLKGQLQQQHSDIIALQDQMLSRKQTKLMADDDEFVMIDKIVYN